MNIATLIKLVLTILAAVLPQIKAAGLQDAVDGIEAAIDELENVHASEVTRVQLEGLRVEQLW